MDENRTDVPMIPKHQAEMHDMHLVHVNSNMKIVCIVVAIVVAIMSIAYCVSTNLLASKFVDSYTSRTEKWLETLLQMQGHTEVLNEKVSSGDVQQLPIP